MVAVQLLAALSLLGAATGELRMVRSSTLRAGNATAKVSVHKGAESFQAWYDAHTSGRGIWKWNNALAAYTRHFSCYKGKPVKLAEVGVQSGGSVLMWQDVLGDKCTVYGLDINPECKEFKNDKTVITIGDQGDPNMWKQFYAKTTPDLDILIDDGGHEIHQMWTTLTQTFPKLNKGGFVSIEDMHGSHHVQEFFNPLAEYLTGQAKEGTLDSVHVYPYVLMVQKAGGGEAHALKYSGKEVEVSSLQQIWDAIDTSKHWGDHIVLRNPKWENFFAEELLRKFFGHFSNLHSYSMYDVPPGCAHTAAAVCTNYIRTEHTTQAKVTGIHIYKDRLVVEVPAEEVSIQAVRRGDKFIGYGF